MTSANGPSQDVPGRKLKMISRIPGPTDNTMLSGTHHEAVTDPDDAIAAGRTIG